MTRPTRSRSRHARETKPLPLGLPKDESGEDLLPHKPLVAIVGRPNVGKSTLFNRIVGHRTAIVDDVSGVTRDRNMAECEYQNCMFILVDTGGLDLKAEDVIEIIKLAEFAIGKHELSAFFRRPGHKNYRECKDQVLRNFLKGLQIKYRDNVYLRTNKG